MFSLFKSADESEVLKKRAKQAYEKVTSSTSTSAEAQNLCRGMALLCCAHLDKTFIAGAEKTADWQQMSAFAAAKGGPAPALPKAEEFQRVRSGKSDIWVYLPIKFAERAFMYGARYQRTELSSEQAIVFMQQLADWITRSEIGYESQVTVLKFLREELSQSDMQSDVQEDFGDLSDDSPEPAA